MKRKTSTTKSKKLKSTLEPSVRGFTTNKTLIAISAIAATVVIGSLLYLFKPVTKTPIVITNTVQKVTPTPVSTTSATEWKTYTNTEAGFAFKYPAKVPVNQEPATSSSINLFVNAEKISNIPEDLPMLMGRADALKEKARLAKGEGEGIVKIGSLYGQTDMVLSQFEVCSVILNRKITFYPNDYRVIVTLSGPKAEIMQSMPEFFMVDKANCGTYKVWDRTKVTSFESTLATKQGKGIAQEWFDTFDSIVKTIEINSGTPKSIAPSVTPTIATGVKAAPEGWLTYTNAKYGFEVLYPKSYKALDDKENLYGYPKGAVLLYKGGQAYDIIIEVWDKESDYKNNYPGRLDDITVIKSNGKFITLFDNTKAPDNKKIIESFKQ